MLQWTIEKVILELRYTWKISRNASDSKTNFFIRVSDNDLEGVGEVAPNIRYDETPEQVQKEFEVFLASKPGLFRSVDELGEHLDKIKLSHSLRFGIESAYIHLDCARKKISVPEYLGLEQVNSVPVSFSIPMMDIGKMKSFYLENNLERFRFIKIKVGAEEMQDSIIHLSSFCPRPLIVDANEAFTDVDNCIRALEKIKRKNIEFIEQPMPAAMVEESAYLKKHSTLALFGDESITHEADFGLLSTLFDGINVKLMKAGGYINAIALLKGAKKNKMKTMIGCMVETTLAISSGIHISSLADYADLDSFLVLKNEPFGLVKELDGNISLK